jgi:hypothetical protein
VFFLLILNLNVEYVLPSGVSDVDEVDDQVVANYWEGWGVVSFSQLQIPLV